MSQDHARDSWGKDHLTQASHGPHSRLRHYGYDRPFASAPDVAGQFERSRDPSLEAQRKDLGRSEAERREQAGGSRMVRQDKPAPKLKPKSHLRRETDRETFNQNWMREHAQAALRNREPRQSSPYPARQPTRSPSHGPSMS